jgi:hypothetical protein
MGEPVEVGVPWTARIVSFVYKFNWRREVVRQRTGGLHAKARCKSGDMGTKESMAQTAVGESDVKEP